MVLLDFWTHSEDLEYENKGFLLLFACWVIFQAFVVGGGGGGGGGG